MWPIIIACRGASGCNPTQAGAWSGQPTVGGRPPAQVLCSGQCKISYLICSYQFSDLCVQFASTIVKMDSWKSPLLPLRFYPLPLGGKRYPKLRSIASAASASPAQVKEVDPNPQPRDKSGEIKPKSYLSRSWSFQAVRRNRYRRSKVQQIFSW